MAEFVNPIGKIRGKIGNVIGYVRADGKNYCKKASIDRKSGGELQKRHSAAFGTLSGGARWIAEVTRLGFPGENGCPKDFKGFISANVENAVIVEKIEPEAPVSRRKKAMQEFQGTIDYGKLRVAAGQLVSPVAGAEVDEGQRKVSFTHQGAPAESVDCFLDDKIYGVLLAVSGQHCHVEELGTRGETFEASMDFPPRAKADEIFVYVFAARADGKDASNSACVREAGR